MIRKIPQIIVAAWLLLAEPAFATWSIIAVNSSSGEIVMASATCLTQKELSGMGAVDLRDVQAVVAPGKGAAMLQAMLDTTGSNKKLVRDELQSGTTPAGILDRLRRTDAGLEARQIGILDLQGRNLGFTGRLTVETALSENGRIGADVYYQIQGNILLDESVIHEAARALQGTSGALSDRVMDAMAAADAAGGDRRCTGDKTAEVAYLWIVDGTGKETYLSVTDENIGPGESINPVRTLRLRYDRALLH